MTLLAPLAALLFLAPGPSQPVKPAPTPAEKPQAGPAAPAAPPATTRWDQRLQLLDPARPMDYFLLGEEVAGDADDADTRALARHLYVLAYELDARVTGSHQRTRVGPSVCLALAALATRQEERRWLAALAQTLSDRAIAPAGVPAARDETQPAETAFDLATAMGLARAGEGRRADQLLDKPGVSELLDRLDAAPMPDGSISGLKSFIRRAVRDWPVCPQCRNRRVVPAGANKTGEMTLCDTCRGNPGPKLTEPELANQLRLEAVLLQGTQRSWAAQVLSDSGAPLRDLDPAELPGTYAVDPTKPLWRDAQWSPVPAAPGEPAPAGAEAPPDKE